MSKIMICCNDNISDDKSLEHVFLQTDYLGNIYLKYNDKYYIVSLDSYTESGIELNRIYNVNIFRKNLLESQFLKDAVKKGIIKTNSSSLSGRAYESLNDMNDEEREEYISKNDFSCFDASFHERKYFWVQYNEEDEPTEGDEDSNFYLNGIAENTCHDGIQYSDLLSLNTGSFDTILIKGDTTSKKVISNTERIDGYCTARLTVYTSGHFRTNFIDSSKMGRLCISNSDKDADIVIKKISN